MTCYECEKCGATTKDIVQDSYYYDEDANLIQVFKCVKCGEEKHIDARFSGVCTSFLVPPYMINEEES